MLDQYRRFAMDAKPKPTKENDNDLDVQVSVANDAIVVTMPGTSYSVTYRKRDEPWLLASDIRDDKNSPISKFTFRARAWTAANDKARELGWII
jgi:hypothetical protein